MNSLPLAASVVERLWNIAEITMTSHYLGYKRLSNGVLTIGLTP